MLWPGQEILFKKQLFDLEVKGQGPTKVITVHDTPPYGHAPTYQISYLKWSKKCVTVTDIEIGIDLVCLYYILN
jgi:hypothetical protein